jgi:hypothetical protein
VHHPILKSPASGEVPLPRRLSPLRVARAALGAAAAASFIALAAGCVVAVRPAPVTVYAPPPEEVVVTDLPPAPVAEVVGVAPEPGFVWIGGYYHWAGSRWAWYAGHYERPPHPGARWIAPRYVIRGGSRVYIRGYWR